MRHLFDTVLTSYTYFHFCKVKNSIWLLACQARKWFYFPFQNQLWCIKDSVWRYFKKNTFFFTLKKTQKPTLSSGKKLESQVKWKYEGYSNKLNLRFFSKTIDKSGYVGKYNTLYPIKDPSPEKGANRHTATLFNSNSQT